MKRILIIVAILAIPVAGWGFWWTHNPPASTGTTLPTATWIAHLPLDDNAANGTVANSLGAAWSCANSTNTVHSEDYKEGTGSFLINDNNDVVYTGTNWTSEKIALLFWFNFTTSNAAAGEYLLNIGDGDVNVEAGEVHIQRRTDLGAGTLDEIVVSGWTGAAITRIWTTDFNSVLATWYRIAIYIDVSVSPWDVSVYKSTDGTTFSKCTMSAWNNGNPAAIAAIDGDFTSVVGTLATDGARGIADDVYIGSY